jgi:hypothetical protein
MNLLPMLGIELINGRMTLSVPMTPSEFEQAEVIANQRREWQIERIGWLVMAVVLVAGALGGFGGGPLAHASRLTGSTGFTFDRLARHGVPSELALTVGPEAVVNGRIRVSLNWPYLRGLDFRDVRPTPLSSTSVDDQLVFEFAAPPSGSSTIVFEIEPRKAGKRAGHIEVSGGTTLDFEQIVFP